SVFVLWFAVGGCSDKSVEPERPRDRRQGAVGDQRLHGKRRRWGQQIAVAMMAGGERKAGNRRCSKDRSIVDRAWPEAGPHRVDRHLLNGREARRAASSRG